EEHAERPQVFLRDPQFQICSTVSFPEVPPGVSLKRFAEVLELAGSRGPGVRRPIHNPSKEIFAQKERLIRGHRDQHETVRGLIKIAVPEKLDELSEFEFSAMTLHDAAPTTRHRDERPGKPDLFLSTISSKPSKRPRFRSSLKSRVGAERAALAVTSFG